MWQPRVEGGLFRPFTAEKFGILDSLKQIEWSCSHDAIFVLLLIVINLRIQFQIIEPRGAPNAAKLGFYDCSFQGKLEDEKKTEMR